jgi:hypothetical protein
MAHIVGRTLTPTWRKRQGNSEDNRETNQREPALPPEPDRRIRYGAAPLDAHVPPLAGTGIALGVVIQGGGYRK